MARQHQQILFHMWNHTPLRLRVWQIHTLLRLRILFYQSLLNACCLTLAGHLLMLKLLISNITTPVFIILLTLLGGLVLAFSLLFSQYHSQLGHLTLITHWSQLLLQLLPIFLKSYTDPSFGLSSYFTEKILQVSASKPQTLSMSSPCIGKRLKGARAEAGQQV